MEYLLLSGVTLGGILTIVGIVYGVFRWALITKVMIIVMPVVFIIVILGYWVGTKGITVATIAVGCGVGVPSVVTVFLITNKMLFKPFTARALYMEDESEYLARQVAEISAVMRDVANEGDLSRVLQAERDDDVGSRRPPVEAVQLLIPGVAAHAQLVAGHVVGGRRQILAVVPGWRGQREAVGHLHAGRRRPDVAVSVAVAVHVAVHVAVAVHITVAVHVAVAVAIARVVIATGHGQDRRKQEQESHQEPIHSVPSESALCHGGGQVDSGRPASPLPRPASR